MVQGIAEPLKAIPPHPERREGGRGWRGGEKGERRRGRRAEGEGGEEKGRRGERKGRIKITVHMRRKLTSVAGYVICHQMIIHSHADVNKAFAPSRYMTCNVATTFH